MQRVSGWTAYDNDLTGDGGEQEWRDGGPRLARLDIRVGYRDGRDQGSVIWLLSDAAAVELLGIRRENNDAIARTFKIPSESLAWWNDIGHFAGIVVMVSTWAAAGVVGGGVYDALKQATKVMGQRTLTSQRPQAIMTLDEAESMARWIVCSEFHHECDCADVGRGSASATYDWSRASDDEEERLVRPAYEFSMLLRSASFDGEKWSVTLEKLPDDTRHPECHYLIGGIKGPAFFTCVTVRYLDDELGTPEMDYE